MPERRVKLVFASGSEELIPAYLEKVKQAGPDLPLVVVSEFPPPQGRWIPFYVVRSWTENLARTRAALRGHSVEFATILLDSKMPYRGMRLMSHLITPRVLLFNRNLDHFRLHPACAVPIARHMYWRVKEVLVFQFHPGGDLYTFFWRFGHPKHWRRPVLNLAARPAGWIARAIKALLPARPDPAAERSLTPGITVVIPSRNGKDLLARMLPSLVRELEGIPSEILVVDNGSSDRTAKFLAKEYPQVRAREFPEPLSFAAAVNRGIEQARFAHVCLLNNDMVLEPGFFPPLRRAFDEIPDLFCSTAQIFFPAGVRREETGKAVKPPREPGSRSLDFLLRCDAPLEGESQSPVLYGSGGCSLYDTAKLRRMGMFGEMFRPAYCEDLDAGYRAWLRGWPTVFVAEARVVHHHRATTSRYYSPEALELVVEVNYLRFLMRSIASPATFQRLWKEALWRLNLKGSQHFISFVANATLSFALRAPRWIERPPVVTIPDDEVLALGSGNIAVFPGRAARGKPVVLIASPYLPFPLSHGGAVRMYNLMRRAAQDYALVLVTFAESLRPVPDELLDLCVEVVEVLRPGTHHLPSTGRPDVVEEFDLPEMHAALHQAVRKWSPKVAQLEFTQMALYAEDCAPAKTVLVEHDITLDLYTQLVETAQGDDWDLRRQLERWNRFERNAWRQVDCVVTMSDKDRRAVAASRRVEVLENGVDIERFQPGTGTPDPARILFIGAFQHLPNLLAVEFFLNEVWPRLRRYSPVFHLIAGRRHRHFLEQHKDRVHIDLDQPGIEVEDFVVDVRPAYRRAAVVVAPLLASAGTNIKIMEAMAMGKAIVSSRAGVNGLDVTPGVDFLLGQSGEEMAQAIAALFEDPTHRAAFEEAARRTAVERYDWDVIARRQRDLYESLRISQTSTR